LPPRGLQGRPQRQAPRAAGLPSARLTDVWDDLEHGTRSAYLNLGCRCMTCSEGAGPVERAATQPGQAPVIPRHELSGRIVLTIGRVMSSLCVVGLIILLVG
jgi:hypothetical protein